eukprot:TRINITY_DN1346_c0_g1_i4.p5 TRINITY_DN1346_c0_g1~~TRINITY_DN1346_c0_g1_i4.p5  ORF type:complete len:154 (-),score=30.55 TRINITY_DN1346_c0_g1_i4:1177-1638(-)
MVPLVSLLPQLLDSTSNKWFPTFHTVSTPSPVISTNTRGRTHKNKGERRMSEREGEKRREASLRSQVTWNTCKWKGGKVEGKRRDRAKGRGHSDILIYKGKEYLTSNNNLPTTLQALCRHQGIHFQNYLTTSELCGSCGRNVKVRMRYCKRAL